MTLQILEDENFTKHNDKINAQTDGGSLIAGPVIVDQPKEEEKPVEEVKDEAKPVEETAPVTTEAPAAEE